MKRRREQAVDPAGQQDAKTDGVRLHDRIGGVANLHERAVGRLCESGTGQRDDRVLAGLSDNPQHRGVRRRVGETRGQIEALHDCVQQDRRDEDAAAHREQRQHCRRLAHAARQIREGKRALCQPSPHSHGQIAKTVTQAILAGECESGILICGTGIGMSIAANKAHGIRAALCSEPYSARMAREHNDANVLCLGGRVVGPGLALDILNAWLGGKFAGGRHQRRVEKIGQIETEQHA